MSDQVQISIEADKVGRSRQRCKQREEILKATEFPSGQDSPSQAEILELQQAVQNGNVDSFCGCVGAIMFKEVTFVSHI